MWSVLSEPKGVWTWFGVGGGLEEIVIEEEEEKRSSLFAVSLCRGNNQFASRFFGASLGQRLSNAENSRAELND